MINKMNYKLYFVIIIFSALFLFGFSLYKSLKIKQHPTFYLAGAFNQKQFLNKLIQKIEKSTKLKCTWNWSKVEEQNTSREIFGYYAKKDIDGVVDADVFIAVFNDPNYSYRGTSTELGCAIGLEKDIFIYNPHDNIDEIEVSDEDVKDNCSDEKYIENFNAKTNCFYHHPNITHTNKFSKLIRFIQEKY